MEECVFTVRQCDDTRWHVYENGLTWSLASFGLKEDAIEYARDLARPRPTEEGPHPAVEVKVRRESIGA